MMSTMSNQQLAFFSTLAVVNAITAQTNEGLGLVMNRLAVVLCLVVLLFVKDKESNS